MVGVNHFQIILLVVHPIASKKGSRTQKRPKRYGTPQPPPSNHHQISISGRDAGGFPISGWLDRSSAELVQQSTCKTSASRSSSSIIASSALAIEASEITTEIASEILDGNPQKYQTHALFKKHPPTPSEYSRRSMANVQVVLQPSSLE